MTLSKKVMLMAAVMIGGLALFVLGAVWRTAASPALFGVGLALVFGGLLAGGLGIRCPQCDEPLFRNYFCAYCPHCGAKLHWNE